MAELSSRILPDDRQPVIIAARRTPICRANGALKTLHAHELLAPVLHRLLSLNQSPDTDYVDEEKVKAEVTAARRMFADNDWPVLDVTRRSIEETAAAIINLFNERELRQVQTA